MKSPGGLATALSSSGALGRQVWIGSSGVLPETSEERQILQSALSSERAIDVALDPEEAARFYDFSNGILWPLFHYLPGQLPLRVEGWSDYHSVNAKFADVIAEHYEDGDLVWVHDYQLMLVPRLLREQLPNATIGFFLHIPFPGAEIFSILPHRSEILRGLLGADLIGFHTNRYRQHFEVSVRRIAKLETKGGHLDYDGRLIDLGVFPVGINARRYQEEAQSRHVRAEMGRVRAAGHKLIVGVDRLDYTKGVPRRLLAIEALLDKHPEWHGRVRFVQVAVPSRDTVRAYRRFRQEVNSLVGSINGKFGTPYWTPVHYVHRSVAETQLLALYRAADVMLVTPIRDGMNLVAKEFVATRSDEDGVLILSEFAGAAAELHDAVIVNPFDVEETARQIDVALRLEKPERQRRMRKLRETVFRNDVDRWVGGFLERLIQLSRHGIAPN